MPFDCLLKSISFSLSRGEALLPHFSTGHILSTALAQVWSVNTIHQSVLRSRLDYIVTPLKPSSYPRRNIPITISSSSILTQCPSRDATAIRAFTMTIELTPPNSLLLSLQIATRQNLLHSSGLWSLELISPKRYCSLSCIGIKSYFGPQIMNVIRHYWERGRSEILETWKAPAESHGTWIGDIRYPLLRITSSWDLKELHPFMSCTKSKRLLSKLLSSNLRLMHAEEMKANFEH